MKHRHSLLTSLYFFLLVVTKSSAFVVPTPKTPPRSLLRTRLSAESLDALRKLEYKTPDDLMIKQLLDSYGEQSRRYRRDAFSAVDWIRARRSTRFIDNIKTTFSSGLIRQLSVVLRFIATITTFVVLYNDILIKGWNFGGIQYSGIAPWMPPLILPMAPFTLSMSVLGLLLGFRTNSSYNRWNEARTAWGRVINDSRSIARVGCIWAKSYRNMDNASLRRLGEAICSFSRSLMNRTLSPQEDSNAFKIYCMTRLTDQNYAKVLLDAQFRPTAALGEISSILVDFQLNPLHQIEAERLVSELCSSYGACERILTSPIPKVYPRNVARFLLFWLMLLPTALYEPLSITWNHLGLVPVMVILSSFFLGVEELATQLEEPFSVLPMERFCDVSIRTPVMEQVKRSQRGIQSRNYGPSAKSSVMTASYSSSEAKMVPPPIPETTIDYENPYPSEPAAASPLFPSRSGLSPY